MVNELCELASSGLDEKQIATFGVVLIIIGAILFIASKNGWIRAKLLFPIFLLLFTITSPLQQVIFAQSAETCPPTQSNNQTTIAIGGLIDDNPELTYDSEYGDYYSSFTILPNDSAPNGDPFDVSTLQLLGSYPNPYSPHFFLILDPNNPIPPATPGFPGNPDWDNVWGSWQLVLTCDIEDTDHCGTDPGDNIVCTDPSDGTCWPTGEVMVYFSSQAEPGDYTIQYTVNTESGATLIPATITVTVPDTPPLFTVITGSEVNDFGGCDVWPPDFSLDLMDGSFFSTDGPGTLLANTIDLDPDTPGRQTSITIYDEGDGDNYVTYTVDDNGILTMTTPQSEYEGFNTYILYITIQDSNGFSPVSPATYTRSPGCA